jgi:hypothetical protein
MFHLLGQNQQKNKKKVNRCNQVNTRGKWINVALEEAMDAIENGTSLGKLMKHWNIPLSSMSNHLNGKTRNRPCEPTSVLTKEEDHVLVTWTLAM